MKKKIGIIDADVLQGKTRYPNLALMKLSGYHKGKGSKVTLLNGYGDIAKYGKVFVGKVFTWTEVPLGLSKRKNVEIGGTGFFGKDAPDLPDKIEHHYPDYTLYAEYVAMMMANGSPENHFKKYTEFSTGFMTRGCFRKCPFCVNRKYDRVIGHSQLDEFMNTDMKYINCLDDNVFGYKDWEDVFKQLSDSGKPFTFSQGLDIRLLTAKKAKVLEASRYAGPVVFAFDNYREKNTIVRKLKLWREHSNKPTRIFVLCAFESQDEKDIATVFERLKIIKSFGCVALIMRFEKWKEAPVECKGIYSSVNSYCFLYGFFQRGSFREFCIYSGMKNTVRDKYIKDKYKLTTYKIKQHLKDGHKKGSSWRAMEAFEAKYPKIAKRYFDSV